MDVSVSLSRLDDTFEEQMKFLKQIGVGHIDTYGGFIPGLEAGNLENTAKVINKIQDAGLNVRVLNFDFENALMGRPKGEKELEVACETIKLLGKMDIPIMRIFPQGIRLGPSGVPGRYEREHRGGYRTAAFNLEYMRKELAKRDMDSKWAHHYREKITPDEYLSNWVKVLQRLVPIAEDSGVRIVGHFDDPPVSEFEGLLPGFPDPLYINRVFEAVPSKNVGILFCVGTRYESGRDIYEQVRLFGRKIFHVHFRNVRGTIPSSGGYDEVALDDGDMDMFRVLKALKEVGYDGALNPDHLPILIGDEKGRASLAFAVGYIKALISALS